MHSFYVKKIQIHIIIVKGSIVLEYQNIPNHSHTDGPSSCSTFFTIMWNTTKTSPEIIA